MTLATLDILFRNFGFIAPKTLIYLAFQSLDFERTWWRLFQKRVVRTKFDIYVYIVSVWIVYSWLSNVHYTLSIMYQFLNITQLFVSFEVLTEGLLDRVVKGIDCWSWA